jgi:NTP pyrophosphatase (non-canonical NTP hydrolase)
MDRYASTKQIINDMASVKMEMNSHKMLIENNEPHDLLMMLNDEIVELQEAVASKDTDLMHIIEEAADAQNFLTAIVHQAVTAYRERKK